MDELNVNAAQEAALDPAAAVESAPADQPDAFMEGFDDGDDLATADQSEQSDAGDAPAAGAAADQPQAEQPGEAADAQQAQAAGSGDHTAADGTGAPADGQQGQNAPMWIIKRMGETHTMTAEQITPELLQKGLDYDRLRGKYDEAKPVMEMFSDLARKAGMSVNDFAKSIRAETKKAQGMSEAEARRTIELEDREAALAAAQQRAQEAANARAQESARVRADIAEFARAFPDVYKQAGGDPKTVIPQSVWADVDKGMSLVAAYGRYIAANAAAQIEAANKRADTTAKNAANAARSTGSQKSAGNDSKNKDAFLEAFDD